MGRFRPPVYPSDHAPVTVIFDVNLLKSPEKQDEDILNRTAQLGSHATAKPKLSYPEGVPRCKRQIKSVDVDAVAFTTHLESIDPPDVTSLDIEDSSQQFSDAMYFGAKSCLKRAREKSCPRITSNNSELDRWKSIVKCDDEKLLWKAINWRGEVNFQHVDEEKPPDDAFKTHLENLFYPDGSEPLSTHELLEDYNTSVPLLDDEISPVEVAEVIHKQVKPNKSCGPDGVSPGLFKCLPAQWLLSLTMLFNVCFYATYPANWMYARLMMLFKKGDKLSCDNYRGISIINAIAKIYDYVLYNRLSEWFKPDREQAGAQPSRGCMEHIVSLRLLMNFCFRKRKKLFIVFVDFSKAYDRVSRKILFTVLKKLGCGLIMLAALISMYKVTHSILGMAVISAVVGVRQGSPTSCFLFILFVNVLIRNIKLRSGPDSFLEWLHVLMLMDDTVIFATSRERMTQKLDILLEYCVSHGMVMNESKTKFMVLNGDSSDREPFPLGDIIIKLCKSYVYLGAIFTADGSTASSLSAHAKEKRSQLNKLLIFFRNNPDMPFFVKRKVLEAAFNSSILYGCESWLDVSFRKMEVIYMSAIRALLGEYT